MRVLLQDTLCVQITIYNTWSFFVNQTILGQRSLTDKYLCWSYSTCRSNYRSVWAATHKYMIGRKCFYLSVTLRWNHLRWLIVFEGKCFYSKDHGNHVQHEWNGLMKWLVQEEISGVRSSSKMHKLLRTFLLQNLGRWTVCDVFMHKSFIFLLSDIFLSVFFQNYVEYYFNIVIPPSVNIFLSFFVPKLTADANVLRSNDIS